ncbi:MAG TPA: 3-isopropylmalate dehydrogenase [Candidatus Angelobacter sp.]|jgi:3-isopropylmalate dehydrogenase|nr:3-isopropylmalate dehydrogenase [Candidatus Angelobacter sp.]
MRFQIAVLPGDGIGPEVCREAIRALRALNAFYDCEFQFVERPVGGEAIRKTGNPLPPATLDTCLNADAVLLGAVGAPEFDHLRGMQRPEGGLLQLRTALGGFANLRPATSFSAIVDCSPLRRSKVEGADILIVRELLGGLYFAEPRGFSEDRNSGFNTMRYSVEEIERVAHVAFQQARGRRKKLTSVDKANVLETSQLWRETVIRVSSVYPEVKLEHMYVDACAMHLITNPTRFDVILTENLFGDILSDEAAAITGSLGMLASATVGGTVNLYEPVHGSAPDIAGKGIGNPLGAIASAAMLLRHSARMPREADELESAIAKVLDDGYRTADLSGSGQVDNNLRIVGTSAMGELVEHAFVSMLDRRFSYHAV